MDKASSLHFFHQANPGLTCPQALLQLTIALALENVWSLFLTIYVTDSSWFGLSGPLLGELHVFLFMQLSLCRNFIFKSFFPQLTRLLLPLPFLLLFQRGGLFWSGWWLSVGGRWGRGWWIWFAGLWGGGRWVEIHWNTCFFLLKVLNVKDFLPRFFFFKEEEEVEDWPASTAGDRKKHFLMLWNKWV